MTVSHAFESEKLIRFHHCDPAGIVFYPQYFVLFHELMEDWFSIGLGVDYARFVADDRLGLPMGRIECEFLSPSRIGDKLKLRLWVKRIGVSSLTLAVEGISQDETRVRATLIVIQASLDTHRSVPFSPALREGLERFAI